MKEKMGRLTSKTFLKPGDVIGVSRKGLYEHYAIYMGNDRVIHYCGEGNDFVECMKEIFWTDKEIVDAICQ